MPACTFTFSNNTVAVKIISGNDRIWTSQECRSLPTVEDLVVRAEKPERVGDALERSPVQRRLQALSAPWAEQGYYHVVAAPLGRRADRPAVQADQPLAEDRHQGAEAGARPKSRPSPTDEPTQQPSGATEPS